MGARPGIGAWLEDEEVQEEQNEEEEEGRGGGGEEERTVKIREPLSEVRESICLRYIELSH